MVKLISCTKGIEGMSAEELVAFTARVSNPANQMNMETAPKLIAYLIKNKHWSPLEMSSATIEIETSRGIAAQILRHRSFSFQEFCISGQSKITIIQSNGTPHYVSISKLYERQKWGQYKNIRIRVFDEEKKEFTSATFKEIFYTGKKECVRVEFEDGKSIVCTQDHKFYTSKGFLPLNKALGLQLIGKTWTMENPMSLAVNGQDAYRDYNWMKLAKERSIWNKTGLEGIAKEAGTSSHTIRKWLKRLKLVFTRKEVASYTTIWNTGKTGYKLPSRTDEQRKHMRDITPKGKDHHAYRGGSGAHRKAIANFFNPIRKEIFAKFNYECQMCFKSFGAIKGRIDIHHIKSVSEYPDLAYELENVIPVHRSCHMKYHGKKHGMLFRSKHKGNTLVPRFKKVVSVKTVGVIDTFDIEVNHPSHNYVADKILVHNSQRYAEAQEVVYYEARRQDTKNRQNSIADMSEGDKKWFLQAQQNVWHWSLKLYKEALEKGIAKEQARFLLPLNTKTRLYMSGTLRSWAHYIELRSANGTQKEHMDIAVGCKNIFREHFPMIAEALGWMV